MSRHIPRWAAMLAIAALAVVAGVVASLATSSSAGQPAARLGNHIEAVGTEREGGPNESIELIKHHDQLVAKAAAPFDRVAPGAYGAAVDKRNKAPKASLGTWSPIGSTPLHADSPDYAGTDPLLGAGVSQLGWHTLSGRITAWTYDPSTSGRIFAAPATGGVWESTDGGSSWRSVGDNLPTGAMGGVAFSKANGGTLIAGTGDSAVGGIFTPSGLGVYTSRNDGKTWTKATGVPDGLVVYRVAVDPNNANINYVATSKGLYRSTDDGVSYTNVVVPTTCTDVNDVTCNFANTISDVAVQPGTGAVIAVAGWAYGQLKTKAGFTMAPQNGIYTSPNGAPGTFVFRDPGGTAPTKNGFAPTPVVGRTSLSIAAGPGQDHDIVYALVQDATKLQGCYDPAIDIPICGSPQDPTLAQATYLDGMYVSQDFGKTWTKIMSPEQLRAPGTGSALQLGILGYGPGIQSWYNNWILADPGATDPVTHAPTRVLFGLEEIWENQIPAAPVTAPTTWKVIGRYWNACAQVVSGVDCAGGNSPIPGSTTHPDQHAAMIVPDAVGSGETLYVGNDGGAYKQHVFAGQDFTNENWGDGINTGLRTLQPYDAQAAKDGTVVMGLQDNGEAKISPNGRTDMIFGGDGFYTGIDPDNSNRIVEEYAGSTAARRGRATRRGSTGRSSQRRSSSTRRTPTTCSSPAARSTRRSTPIRVTAIPIRPSRGQPASSSTTGTRCTTSARSASHSTQASSRSPAATVRRPPPTSAATMRTQAGAARAASAGRARSRTGSPPTSAEPRRRSSTPRTDGTWPRPRGCRTAGSRPSGSTRATRRAGPCTSRSAATRPTGSRRERSGIRSPTSGRGMSTSRATPVRPSPTSRARCRTRRPTGCFPSRAASSSAPTSAYSSPPA
jgi:hypothetical protein